MMGHTEIGELAYRVQAVLDGVRRGQVRRVKLFYLRQLKGKAARIKEKRLA